MTLAAWLVFALAQGSPTPLEQARAELERERQALAAETAAFAAAEARHPQNAGPRPRPVATPSKGVRPTPLGNDDLPPRAEPPKADPTPLGDDDLPPAGPADLAALRALAEGQALEAAERPGPDHGRQVLQRLVDRFEGLDGADPRATAAWATEVVQHLLTQHAESTRTSLERVSLWTAHGRFSEVELWRAGHVAWAYADPNGGVALAVPTPGEARAYRWQADLDPGTVARVRALFDTATPWVAMPLDPGWLPAVERRGPTPGWRERLAAGGVLMWPLAALGLVGLALVLERSVTLFLRQRRRSPVVAQVLADVADGHLGTARTRCLAAPGPVTRALAAVLADPQRPREALTETLDTQILHEVPRLQRFLAGIAVIAATAPLLGLLGTVTGIIETFAVLQTQGEADVTAMAGGISEALFTTAAGLVVAIPLSLAGGLLRARVERLLGDLEAHGAALLERLGREVPR